MSVIDAASSRPLEGGASFTLANRLFRVAWAISWLLMARWTPPPLHRWRALILQAFGANVATSARVHASVRIWHPRNLTLGAHALIGPGAILYNQGHIFVGERAVISQRAHVCASSHDVQDRNFQLILRPVTIGRGCWVAAEAFVGPGVVMADFSVLAARGALFRSTEANGIYRGNPAELVRHRAMEGAPVKTR